MKITFCKKACCPFIELKDNKIHLGDPEGPEGVTIWSKESFSDFLSDAKSGKFDNLVK